MSKNSANAPHPIDPVQLPHVATPLKKVNAATGPVVPRNVPILDQDFDDLEPPDSVDSAESNWYEP